MDPLRIAMILGGGALLICATCFGLAALWFLFCRLEGKRAPPLRVASLVALLSLAGGVGLLFKSDPHNARSFDGRQWRANRFTGSCERGVMAGDLIRFHLKPGMSRAQVVQLLGSPDLIDNEDAFEEWEYELGVCRGFLDYDYLRVAFRADGRMTRAYVWTS